MRDYTKIEAWRLADDLTVAVYERTRSFPKEEMYGLTSQLRRASYSVPANIVAQQNAAFDPVVYKAAFDAYLKTVANTTVVRTEGLARMIDVMKTTTPAAVPSRRGVRTPTT